MTPRPRVSVALCTHNGARFVVEQVRSILEQSEPPSQVVISDDASTDDTVALVEGLWASLTPDRAPELLILRNAVALGVTRNFQQAAEACTGDLVALCDQDDIWRPERLERMVDVFETSPDLGLLFTDARLIDATGTDLGLSLFDALEVRDADLEEIRRGDAFGVLLRRNLVTGATVVFRRTLLDSASPFDPAWVHDEWLAILAAAVSRVDWLHDSLIGYRQHGGNQIGVAAPNLRYKVARVFEPRGDRYTGLAGRAGHLLQRLEVLAAVPPVLDAARAKLLHQERRAQLPAARPARVIPVLREAATGRYRRFSSQGNLDILRDLLGPHA
ncbi:MAG: glycosyltransferase family 2 protein [Rhodoglobus sp.]